MAVTAVAAMRVGAASSGGRKNGRVMVRRGVAVLSMAVAVLVPSASTASAATMLGTHLHTDTNRQGCTGANDPEFLHNPGIGSAMLTDHGDTLAVNLTLKNVVKGATYTITVNQCLDVPNAQVRQDSRSVTATSRGTGSAKFSVTRVVGAPVYLTLTNPSKHDPLAPYWSDTRYF